MFRSWWHSLSSTLLGTRTWPDSLCRKPGSSTASSVLFWITVSKSGSSTTLGAAATCRLGRSSPPSATLPPLRRTGESSSPLTWLPTLRLPASRFCSSWDTRRFSIPKNCGISRTLWWRRGRLIPFWSERCRESTWLRSEAEKQERSWRPWWRGLWRSGSLTHWAELKHSREAMMTHLLSKLLMDHLSRIRSQTGSCQLL